jgi:predicted secreted hydrolase
MQARILLVLSALLWFGPGAAEPRFPEVVPDYKIEFPRDEGSHPQHRTEWWYLTGRLADASGKTFGFQVTFFRYRPGTDEDNPSTFAAKQLLFAHASLSDPTVGRLVRAERTARAGFDLAEAREGRMDVHIDDWRLQRRGGIIDASVATEEFAFDLDFGVEQAPLLQGRDGFSQKSPSPAHASYYYSLPQLRASGSVVVNGKRHTVRGTAWLDHEWFSSVLDERAQGWDWVGLNFADGAALMALRIRTASGEQYWAAAQWRDRDGRARAYAPTDIEWRARRRWRSPRTGIEFPVEWHLRLGERTIALRPLFDDQENDARGSTGTLYWEGAVQALDESGRALGEGYLELTGYGERIRM